MILISNIALMKNTPKVTYSLHTLGILVLLFCTCFRSIGQEGTLLPPPINTVKFTEQNPSLSADGQTMIFESDRQGDWKLFETHKNGGKLWSVPVVLSTVQNNSIKIVAGTSFLSYDGNMLFFAAESLTNSGHEDIYYCERTKSGWTAPQSISGTINTTDLESYPSLSADGKFLYFSKAKFIEGDKKDPLQRCYRIMVAERGGDGLWQKPTELPSPVNMICEKAARIMPDGKTLLISSIRRDGQGSFDLYKTEKINPTTWGQMSSVEGINSTEIEINGSVSACGDLLYYSRAGDIYSTTLNGFASSLLPLKGLVSDSLTGKAIKVTISLLDADKAGIPLAKGISSEADGAFTLLVKAKNRYVLEINEAGYYRKKVLVDLTDNNPCDNLRQLPIKLMPLVRKEQEKSIYQLSLLAVDAQTNMTIPANFEAKEVKSGQIIPLQNDATSLQNKGSFILKEDYSIETEMPGYKPQSFSLRIDDTKELLPVSIIKLEPLTYNFNIKVLDAGTNEIVKNAVVTITNLENNQSAVMGVKPENGECNTNLLNNKGYKVVVSADLFEDNVQLIQKTASMKELSLKLIPKKTSAVNFIAVDAETGVMIPADFVISSEKTGNTFTGKSTQSTEYFAVRLNQNDNLKVQVSAEGYAPARSLVEINDLILGNRREYIVKLVTDRYPLTIKVADAETKKSIKEVSLKVIDLKSGEIRVVTKSTTNEYSTVLKRTGTYEIVIKAEDYIGVSERIESMPSGSALNFTLTKKKTIGADFNVIDEASGKAIKSDITIKAEKAQKTFHFKDAAEVSLKIAEKEVFTVETAAEGYKPKQSTFNMADFVLDKKYEYIIRLERAAFTLKLKVLDKSTNMPIEVDGLSITDLSSKGSRPDVVRLPNGEASVSLTPENKYLLEIMAEGYMPYKEELSKFTKNEWTCLLTPKLQASYLIFSAVDSTSGKSLEASFKISSENNSTASLQGKTSETLPTYKMSITEPQTFSVETFVKGYYLKTEKVTYTQLGKEQKAIIKMARDFSVLSIKAFDANTDRAIGEVFYSITDAVSNRQVAAMITLTNGECSADLKVGKSYLIKAKLAGYKDYEYSYTASKEDKSLNVKLRPFLKQLLFFYAIDPIKKNKVPALFKVISPSGETIASGKTDSNKESVSVSLTEKTNYTIEIIATGYKTYEGSFTADSSMRGELAKRAFWLEKEESRFTFRVIDSQSRLVVPQCKIKLIDVKSNQELVPDLKGDEYATELSPVASYKLEIEATGYNAYVGRVDPATFNNANDKRKDIQLVKKKEAISSQATTKERPLPAQKSIDKIERGKSIVLNNVYFEQSSFILQKESYTELDKLVEILKNNPQTKIEIAGHTDNVGDARLNLALSENRAKVILNYLAQRGISEDRLMYKGYGGSRPVAPNDSEENKRKNRRVEIMGIQ